ncbi:MAG: RNA helicase [Bathelium mastoideum]|nr:MAG: RNA helicase [Bathelium mastoideum]
MTLSPRVAQPLRRNAPDKNAARRRTNNPFGGMNITEANIRQDGPKRSRSQELRSQRGRDKNTKDKKPQTFKALKMQRALASVSYGKRTAVKTKISEVDSFDNFPLLPLIKESISSQALKGLDIVMPTPIQRVAIPALLGSETGKARFRAPKTEEMEQFLLAAETGSGKTLAYLIPTIDAIKRAELEDAQLVKQEVAAKEKKKQQALFELESPPANEPHPTTARPRAIILVPTSELVTQVGSLVKSLGHTVKYRSALISAAYTGVVIRNRLFSTGGIDILVSTPHLLASIAESDPNILSRVSHLIVDEADSLLDRSFSPLTTAILEKATPSLRQLILCSATIPRSLDGLLRKRFPDCRRLVTPNLHAIPRRVQLGVVDVTREPYRGNKSLACADAIWSIGRAATEHFEDGERERVDVKRIIVFVNEREKTAEVAEYLVSKGVDAVALSRDAGEQRQGEVLAAFTGAAAPVTAGSKDKNTTEEKVTFSPLLGGNSERNDVTSKRRLPNTKVLVTTDLGSRGIDTLAVRHVILYDVPHTTIDFIHRLGRTGRMGRRGRGIVLVGKSDRKDVVKEVREGMFKGQALI